MPSLGADMEHGKIVEWLIKPGDYVRRGDLVAVKVPDLSGRQVVRLVYRKTGEMSHAAAAFLQLVKVPDTYGRRAATARTSS